MLAASVGPWLLLVLAPRSAPPPEALGEQKVHGVDVSPPTEREVTKPNIEVEAVVVSQEVPRALGAIEGFPEDEVKRVRWGRVQFTPGFDVRNQVGFVSAFKLDRQGNEYDLGGYSTGRVRFAPRLDIDDSVSIVGTVDIANGRWAPSGTNSAVLDDIIEEGTPPPGHKTRLIDGRELYVEARTKIGVFRIGQQAFTWGQGMLANSGNYVDRFGDLRFGGDGPGDLYERVLFGTKPFANTKSKIRDLVVAVGGDLVFRDERASLVHGDLAGQALVVLRYQRPGSANWLGGYAVYRQQKNKDNDVYSNDNQLKVGVVDVAGQGVRKLQCQGTWCRNVVLMGAFETAVVFGRTSFVRDNVGDHRVFQGGAVLRGFIGNPKGWLFGMDAGFASGDPNPDDRQINNFTFDAGHTVGLVLFNPVMGWRSARSQRNAEDPSLVGVPPNGTDFLPTGGGVSNALYVHPKLRWAIRERFEAWGGPLMAFAPSAVVDPYATRLAGGVPTNSRGGDGDERYYGTELDIGLRGRIPLQQLWLQIGLQGGLLFPGRATANTLGNIDKPIGAMWLRTELRF